MKERTGRPEFAELPGEGLTVDMEVGNAPGRLTVAMLDGLRDLTLRALLDGDVLPAQKCPAWSNRFKMARSWFRGIPVELRS